MDCIRPLFTPLFTLIRHLTLLLFSHSLAAPTIAHTRPLFALIRRPPPPPRPPSLSLENSPLALLPPEIIQHIASFLPPSAAASFASTCLPIRRMTGTQYLHALHASRDETLALLELLVADLPIDPTTGIPYHVLCVDCVQLFPLDDGSCRPRTPACIQACTLSREHIQASFATANFHTAMVVHRRGRSPDALLACMTPGATTVYHSDEDVTSQGTFKYSIVGGSLCLRMQEVHILPRGSSQMYTILTRTCAHSHLYQDVVTTEAFSVQTQMRDWICRSSQSKLIHCKYCRTVIMFGARTFRGRGLGLFFSCWRNLGDGRAGDERWAEQLLHTPGPEGWKEISYNGYDIIDGFRRNISPYNRCYFDFDGEETRADRRELFRLSKYAIGSRK